MFERRDVVSLRTKSFLGKLGPFAESGFALLSMRAVSLEAKYKSDNDDGTGHSTLMCFVLGRK